MTEKLYVYCGFVHILVHMVRNGQELCNIGKWFQHFSFCLNDCLKFNSRYREKINCCFNINYGLAIQSCNAGSTLIPTKGTTCWIRVTEKYYSFLIILSLDSCTQ